jgi:hypothetical protein
MKQCGLFDDEEYLTRMNEPDDQLEALSQTVGFEVFHPDLEQTLAYSAGRRGGRPPCSPVLMVRMLVV